MQPLSFHIPQQHPPGEGAFDTHPAAVKRWVQALPMGNAGEAAKRIFGAIREVNALKVPASDRLEMMELLADPLEDVLGMMERHLAESHFPLPRKSLKVAEAGNRLLVQCAIAYQAVLDSWEQGTWLFRKTHSRQWSLSVQRLIHYLGRILGIYRAIQRPCPAGVWLAIHRLFHEAERHGRLGERFLLPGHTDRLETVADSYKRVLLLASLETRLFTRTQLEEVHQQMPVWLKGVALRSPDDWSEEMECYCLRLDLDVPHTVQAGQCREEAGKANALLLDMTALGRLLDGAMSDSGLTLNFAGASMRRETVETLRQCWRVPTGTRSERYRTDKPVEVALGLSAIFSLLRKQGKRLHDGISDQVMSDTLTPLLPVRGRAPVKQRTPTQNDVWDTIFYGTDVVQNSWALSDEECHYRFVPARELNYNKHGSCLEFSPQEQLNLDVGELVAVRESAQGPAQLYVVRWLQESDKSVLAGLLRLACEMEPVLMVIEQESGTTPLGCLLGIGEDQRAVLILPHLPTIHEHTLQLVIDQRKISVRLQEKVALSPLFEAYHFSLLDALDETHFGEEMDMAQVNALLHAIAHSDEQTEASKAEDDFSGLWDSL